eukprot:360299-Chlamydomonas_euryale.AAC.2
MPPSADSLSQPRTQRNPNVGNIIPGPPGFLAAEDAAKHPIVCEGAAESPARRRGCSRSSPFPMTGICDYDHHMTFPVTWTDRNKKCERVRLDLDAQTREATVLTEKYNKQVAKDDQADAVESLKFKMQIAEDKKQRACAADSWGWGPVCGGLRQGAMGCGKE